MASQPAIPAATAPDEAVGHSHRMCFDEALADAIAQLPALEPGHPDAMETIRVEEIGALRGGIAGLHTLYVRVSRAPD